MIGRLSGRLIEKQAPMLLLDVAGVCYEIGAPMSTFYGLPEIGNELTLHTHLLVREDAHLLFGFATRRDRDLFRNLLKVSGVGAKMALALLSGLTASELLKTIRSNDIASLTLIPGIGKKTAERLIVEIKDRLDAWGLDGTDADMLPDSDLAPASQIHDAVSALVSLGYKPAEANRMVRQVDSVDLLSEEIIRRALKAVTI